ncbi:SIR2 family protein [Tolumonas lignilytica]|uniref:SIR2 family protein n=1 Tax=Tolumonas lignilytica TaxID=1283284 RepID=UPI000467AEA9|nr:SIR2 family protein [Tolumonas lignilytica]
MATEFNLHQIYDHNLNFLFGAGASVGFLPTLALEIRDDNGKKHTFETLAKHYESNKEMTTMLFMLYYRECIKPGLPTLPPRPPRLPITEQVITEYKRFITTLIQVLNKQKPSAKRANIFTTNYDNCLEIASEELMAARNSQFEINDGSTGFQTRTFHTKNFNNRVVNKGLLDRHDQYLTQINLLHAHGSVHWTKNEKGDIELNYGASNYIFEFNEKETQILDECRNILYNEEKTLTDLDMVFEIFYDLAELRANKFWPAYNKMPIVNPTKWKFHETVFEEAYYQILRHLSYELERPQSILITFGFSFADEHILSLVLRALSNPSLKMYIVCFDSSVKNWMYSTFGQYPNVEYILSEEHELDFKLFNDEYFTVLKSSKPATPKNADENVIQMVRVDGRDL